MRLTCPNCGAQYEVPAEVIPETGRDVQCSDCGTTWFQLPPDPLEAAHIPAGQASNLETKDLDPPEPSPGGGDTRVEASRGGDDIEEDDFEKALAAILQEDTGPGDVLDEEGAASQRDETGETPAASDTSPEGPVLAPKAEPDSAEIDVDIAQTGADPDLPQERPAAQTAKAGESPRAEISDDNAEGLAPGEVDQVNRRRLDEKISAVLRQEAERETQARALERRGGLETQPDLGLTQRDSSNARQTSRKVEARGPGDAAVGADGGVRITAAAPQADDQNVAPGSHTGPLPDVDEINASLNPQGAQMPKSVGDVDAQAGPKSGGGFRTGFQLAVLISLAAAVLLYVFAPQISAAVPALESVVSAFVSSVDSIRAQLDRFIEGLAASTKEPAAE